MAEERLLVQKTLVIGLGTTGTQICDQLAGHIRWEYGSLDRVPWVRFLCLETNAGGVTRNLHAGDFLPLTISASEYANLVQFAPAYDEAIRLSEWADSETLNKIPHKSVDDGVGNIRMIGRLALFHRRNYDAVRNAVEQRLVDLRGLSGPEASEKFERQEEGGGTRVTFADDRGLRVFVVGTLCGGTCSGLVGDFGYFLQSLTREGEWVIGIFTLPHPDLSTASVPAANRFKKNAYTALVELNHYHRLTGVEKEDLLFPGHPFPTAGCHPYDLPFLATPRDTGGQAQRALETAIKDRIFLNIFVPQTDPFAASINAAVEDRDGHAHCFCTFGLATVEFPAPQVIEACAGRLLLKAIRDWKARTLPDGAKAPRLEEIGLTWPRLRERLLVAHDGSSLATRLNDQVELIVNGAMASEEDGRRELGVLRAAFGDAGVASSGGALTPSLVPQTVATNEVAAAQQVYQALERTVVTRFLHADEGPGCLRDLLAAAKARSDELRKSPARDPQPQIRAVDEAIQKVNESRRKPFLSRKTVVDEQAVRQLREALRQEVEARLDREAMRVLHGIPSVDGTTPGVLTRVHRLLDPVMRRVDNLRGRITSYQTQIERELLRTSEEVPEVNGVPLFDPDRHQGTVTRNYQRCLEEENGDPTSTWEEEEARQARSVIEAWTQATRALFPSETSSDWLRETYINGKEAPLRPEDEAQLWERARRPFHRLRSVNVLDHWSDWPGAVREVERAVGMMEPFLAIDRIQAERGGRKPIDGRSMMLVPGGDESHEFCRQVRAKSGIESKPEACPDRYRAVLIRESYRFPLYGAPEIVGGPGSLATAQANDFPTFHTRKDVFWTGLSETELRQTQTAEELVAVGILLGLLTAEDRALQLTWTPGGIGEQSVKRLPLSIRGAARALVFSRAEVNGNVEDLGGAVGILRARIEQERARIGDDVKLVERLKRAHDSGDFNVIPDWREDRFAGRLVDRFCARDMALFQAWRRVIPLDADHLQSMAKQKGEARPTGGVYPEDGLYCPILTCCSWIGKDEQEAAQKGWRCHVNRHDCSRPPGL
jgi:hypothetical protein